MDQLRQEVVISEACLVGTFWNDPNLYSFYPDDKISRKTFLNPHWGFYFGLGRYMAENQVAIYDDIATAKYVNELNLSETYEEYGGFDTVAEVMDEVEDKKDNLDAYYADVKKYRLLIELGKLFGEAVLQPNGKYDYRKMNKEQLYTYWNDKVISLGLDGDAKYDEYYLLENLEQSIEEWDTNPAIGMPFYKSPKFTKICTGWDFGHVYMYGGFGGSGKTSFVLNKLILSCIAKKEKLLVVANEQSIEEFKKMLIISAMSNVKNNTIPRQRINEGNFTDEEKEKFKKAIAWLKEISGEGQEKLITFVFMENYVMEDVKKLVRYYANRGIRRVLIDTGKPSEGDASMARWERFTEDMKEIYKLARPTSLNLSVWVNVQLADAAIANRYLSEHALGDSKKIKNEVSCLFMGRVIKSDEYANEKNALIVTNWKHDPSNAFANETGYYKETVKLEKNKVYYVLFTVKNRRGQDAKTGQQVLVFEVDFNSNSWKEVGWTTIFDDRGN